MQHISRQVKIVLVAKQVIFQWDKCCRLMVKTDETLLPILDCKLTLSLKQMTRLECLFASMGITSSPGPIPRIEIKLGKSWD